MRTPLARSSTDRSPAFSARESELAPELVDYFGGFQRVISYLFDPEKIFFNNLKRAGVRNLIAGSPKITGEEHAARQLARPLESLALYLDDPAAVVLPNEPRNVVRSLIAIHPGSGSAGKNWPLERFIALATALFRLKEDSRLLLIGGEADEERATQLARALPAERVSVVMNLPLPELAGLLQNCALFIGHDSGISHLAAAVENAMPAPLRSNRSSDLGARESAGARVAFAPAWRWPESKCRTWSTRWASLRTDAHRHEDVKERRSGF